VAGWLKCTSPGTDGKAVYVNMDRVISIVQKDAGARLLHGSGNAAYIDVLESAEEIFRATGAKVSQTGARPGKG